MSFDLAVFCPARALDDTDATALYVALCAGAKDAARHEAEARLVVAPELDAFYTKLTAIYPELDDDEDESPFSCAIQREPKYVILNLSFSRSDEVAHVVEKLALAHGLDTFDPQSRKLLRAAEPGAAPRPAGTPKLPPKEGLARFVAGVEPRLVNLGFSPVPRVKHTWGRTSASGITHRVSLNLGTRNVRPDVSFGHPTAEAWYASAMGKREVVPAMGLQYLYYQGFIPGRDWSEEGDFDYAICHPECVAAAVVDFTRAVVDYAVPFFDALGTLEQVADFYRRPVPYSRARPNWTIERERLSGPAGRYWASARGLVFSTAMRVLAEPSRASEAFAEARARANLWKENEAFGCRPELFGKLDVLEVAVLAKESESIRAKTKTTKSPKKRAD